MTSDNILDILDNPVWTREAGQYFASHRLTTDPRNYHLEILSYRGSSKTRIYQPDLCVSIKLTEYLRSESLSLSHCNTRITHSLYRLLFLLDEIFDHYSLHAPQLIQPNHPLVHSTLGSHSHELEFLHYKAIFCPVRALESK